MDHSDMGTGPKKRPGPKAKKAPKVHACTECDCPPFAGASGLWYHMKSRHNKATRPYTKHKIKKNGKSKTKKYARKANKIAQQTYTGRTGEPHHLTPTGPSNRSTRPVPVYVPLYMKAKVDLTFIFPRAVIMMLFKVNTPHQKWHAATVSFSSWMQDCAGWVRLDFDDGTLKWVHPQQGVYQRWLRPMTRDERMARTQEQQLMHTNIRQLLLKTNVATLGASSWHQLEYRYLKRYAQLLNFPTATLKNDMLSSTKTLVDNMRRFVAGEPLADIVDAMVRTRPVAWWWSSWVQRGVLLKCYMYRLGSLEVLN